MSNKTLIATLKKSRKINEILITRAVKQIEKLEQGLEKFQSDTEKGIASANDVISVCESRISELGSQIQDAEND